MAKAKGSGDLGLAPEKILAFEVSGLRPEMTVEEAKAILAADGWSGEIGFYNDEETFQDTGREVLKGEDMRLQVAAYRDPEGVARVFRIRLYQVFGGIQDLDSWQAALIERYGPPTTNTFPESSESFGTYRMSWETYDGQGDGRSGAAWARENIPNFGCWHRKTVDEVLDACGGSRESLRTEIRKTVFSDNIALWFTIYQNQGDESGSSMEIALVASALRSASERYTQVIEQLDANEAAKANSEGAKVNF
ncbi:MAG: hypothetical protein HRU11_01190 [Parvularculaceae bacterium]|nr:hypothetical protein [Parvularculaceae bacterium]